MPDFYVMRFSPKKIPKKNFKTKQHLVLPTVKYLTRLTKGLKALPRLLFALRAGFLSVIWTPELLFYARPLLMSS